MWIAGVGTSVGMVERMARAWASRHPATALGARARSYFGRHPVGGLGPGLAALLFGALMLTGTPVRARSAGSAIVKVQAAGSVPEVVSRLKEQSPRAARVPAPEPERGAVDVGGDAAEPRAPLTCPLRSPPTPRGSRSKHRRRARPPER